MKRRNADLGKIRRPIKRNKIAEQIGSNTLLYVKFLLLWAIVITADFLLEFRFEFLWPFWLLLRSVHDSFKYKGLAFSVLFVCIAITSDLVCLFFIPVQWLFFAASTYVWVQYVWHTDKGICLPTIILWILFVYLEAAIRWKDSRNIPHLDLCRPFAAHCIGYPVVTLGFGFKSYVGYRIRQRKQREVAKDNDFYMQLLQEALPKEESTSNNTSTTDSAAAQDQQDQMNHQKDLSVTVTAIQNNHLNNNNNSNSNKNAQNQSKLLNNSTAHTNGHAVGAATTSLNGGLSHQHPKHLHRKSLDKDNSSSSSNLTSTNIKTNYSYHQNNSIKETNRSNDLSAPVSANGVQGSHNKEKETNNSSSPSNKKDFEKELTASSTCSSSVSQSAANNNATNSKSVSEEKSSSSSKQQNGHVVNYDMEIQQQTQQENLNNSTSDNHVEKVTRTGRKNRVKQKEINTSKDNQNTNNNNNTQNNTNTYNQTNNSNDTNHVLTSSVKYCESCARLETEAKKLKNEISGLKQNENDLRQRLDLNAVTKSCLLAKQKENDELQNKIQDLASTRLTERQNLQTVERRLCEERRHRQSVESQLNNERKHRKVAEEKAARSECSESCKLKKQQLEMEINKLRRDLISSEDAKHNAEKQSRSFEQEFDFQMRKFEVEMRNRESQPNTEALMSALAAMQDKNATLEKNLSAETRVKLDLFSALGDAKRQLEIHTCSLRNKDKEILDLKAKIVQLLAVMPSMPTESLCLTGPACSSTGSSMMRLNDAPQLLSQSSISGGSNVGTTSNQPCQLLMSGSPLITQLHNLGVLTSSITTSPVPVASTVATTSSSSSQMNAGSNGQIVQMQNNNNSNNNSSNCPSNLDPNATVYTPKNNSIVGGAEA